MRHGAGKKFSHQNAGFLTPGRRAVQSCPVMSDPVPPSTPPAPGPKRIRSVPTPVRGTNLLAASSSGYSEDSNWRRGITWLWVLFGGIALAEACYAVFAALGGYTLQLPPGYDLIPVYLLCAVFLTLWFGWNWTRWILALFAFLFGAWLAVTLLRETDVQLQAGAGIKGQPGTGFLAKLPLVAASLLYLILALYLTFGSDVAAFTKHRREEGRGWVAVPIALLLGVYVVAMMAVPDLYKIWMRQQQAAVTDYGRDTLRTAAEHWDSAVLAARFDDSLLERVPPETRAKMLAIYTPLGPLQRTDQEVSHVSSQFDPQENRFVLRGDYTAWGQFAHGKDHFSFNVSRSLFGPWQVSLFTEDGMAVDRPPAPAAPVPAATPAASPVPPAAG